MDLKEQKNIVTTRFKRHPWEIVRLRILFFLLKKLPAKKFIVDIGSGDAFVATGLSKKLLNSKLAAVDIHYDEQFINGQEETNLVFFKNIHNVPASKPVDVILLMDVLEHIEKPEHMLGKIKELKNISSSTQFIITVPAFQSLFTAHDIFLKHFRRYNRKQLRLLLRQQGFKIKYSGYFFFTLFCGRLFKKLFKIKSKQGVHNWNGSNFFTSVLIVILWIDFKICWYLSRTGINLPGLSCYCICHPLPS